MSRPVHFLLLSVALFTGVAANATTAPPPGDSTLEQRWRSFSRTGAQSQPALEFPYAECFKRAAADHGLPETLLLAVARGESDFDPVARSKANAYGLMQILWPDTAKYLGVDRLSELLDPCTNVAAGARYLKELLERYQGNLHRALAAYNYGPARIPAAGGSLPKGAVWYSGYILRHLDYVLNGDRTGRPAAKRRPYSGQDRLFIIHFARPYRAAAFVESLQQRFGDIRLDWFRLPDGGFDVVMLYSSEKQLTEGRRLLSRMGF